MYIYIYVYIYIYMCVCVCSTMPYPQGVSGLLNVLGGAYPHPGGGYQQPAGATADSDPRTSQQCR